MIVVGIICFIVGGFIGLFFGVVCVAFAAAASERDRLFEDNPCRDCFGAANGDCDDCERMKEGGADEQQSEKKQ